MTDVLTARHLNRTLLTRQSLIERTRSPLADALDGIAGIQAQYAPSMYIGLWTRVAGFGRDQLTKALADRTVVQGTLMRSTIHLVSAGDYWPLAIATRGNRRRSWQRNRREISTNGALMVEVDHAVSAASLSLAERPLTQSEVAQLFGKAAADAIHELSDVVRVPPSGTWERRRANLFGAATAWLGRQPEIDVADASRLVARRYLSSFGPARPHDIAAWAGVPLPQIKDALTRIDLRRYRDEEGRELVDLAELGLADVDIAAPVRFLPTWDNILLVHARRALVIEEADRPRIFHRRNPQSDPTVLVNGVVAGTWRPLDGRIVVESFRRLPRGLQAALNEEAARLQAWWVG